MVNSHFCNVANPVSSNALLNCVITAVAASSSRVPCFVCNHSNFTPSSWCGSRIPSKCGAGNLPARELRHVCAGADARCTYHSRSRSLSSAGIFIRRVRYRSRCSYPSPPRSTHAPSPYRVFGLPPGPRESQLSQQHTRTRRSTQCAKEKKLGDSPSPRGRNASARTAHHL